MLVLPIPLVTSLALAFLLLHMVLRGDRPWLFAALVAACAVQGVVVSLVQYYGVVSMRALQPVMATFIPPLAWVTFQTTAVRALDPGRDPLHLAVPAFTAFCVAVAPAILDLLVTGIFLFYGVMIAYALRDGADALPLARIETGDRPRLIWGGIAFGLILSAVSDGLIALTLMIGADWLQPAILSLFTSLSLGLVGALTLSQSLAHERNVEIPADPVPGPVDTERASDIMARLGKLLTEEALYLDANLTLERLARRLLVPSKQLSAAINRTTGDNVSRYVNGFRIQHACERLKAGDGVTAAMLESGFNTKSNFNREFLRIRGCPPSRWLENKSEARSEHEVRP
ncbi:MAG: helix-turn-helix domain-containing protein [Geminicoccaceae bacterium]